ncbi:hypothetical protein HDU96_002770, partial [Phlyctochytrium bullatum]
MQINLQVFQHLDLGDLIYAAQVCRRWREAARSPFIWESLQLYLDADGFLLHPEVNRINFPLFLSSRQYPDKTETGQIRTESGRHTLSIYRTQTPLPPPRRSHIPIASALAPGNTPLLLPHIRHLDASRSDITDTILTAVLPHLPSLSHLSLSHCYELDALGLALAVAEHCPRLVALDVSSTLVSGRELCHMLKRCKGVRELNVSGCPLLTAQCLMSVVRRLRERVRRLEMAGLQYLTGSAAVAVCEELGRAPDLEFVSLRSNSAVSVAALKALATRLVESSS